MLLGRLRHPEVSPRCKRLGSGLPGLLGSCFWSFLPLSGSGCGCFRCPSCSFHPAPAWFPRRLRLRGCWRWLWLRKLSGRSPVGVLSAWFPARHLLPYWLVGVAAWELASHLSLAFSFGVVVTPGLMDGELERFFPSGCSFFQLLGLPCLRSGGGRQGGQSLAGPSVLQDD